MKMSSLRLYYILLFLLILILKVKCGAINVPKGKVFIKNLQNSNSIELKFNSDNNNLLLIHILPIDCEIKVDAKNKTNINVYQIRNYNYNALYISTNVIPYKLKISPLILLIYF